MTFLLIDCIEYDAPNGRKVIEHVPTNYEVEYDEVTVSKQIALFGLKRMVERNAAD